VNASGVIDADLHAADAARLWAASGCQWLTDPAVGVPVGLVRRVLGLIEALDGRGSGLADLASAGGLGLLAERAALMGLPPSGEVSAGGASRFLKCVDGWLVLTLARGDDYALLPAWLQDDIGTEPDVWPVLRELVADRARAELVEQAVLLGLPCAAVGEVTDTRPVILHHVGAGPAASIRDAVVVSLAALWAGPLCADILARLGARLITVESVQRPDGGRNARRFFEALHGHSESVALDLTTDDDRTVLEALLRRADVVIEGSRPRALEQMGLDARRLAETGPRVWVSITGYGRDPVARHRVGFGDDTAAAGGLVGWAGNEPRFVADAVADPLTGLTAAAVAVELIESGGRWLADAALSRTARSVTEPVIQPTTIPAERPRGRRDPGAPMPLGRDTDATLRSLGVTRTSSSYTL
jgi:hypothetical protein